MVHALVSSKRLRMAFSVDENPLGVLVVAALLLGLALVLATLSVDVDVVVVVVWGCSRLPFAIL